MQNIIVTDGFWRKSLSAVRSLGKSGYNVCVFGDSLFTTSFWSRYTYKRVIAPAAKDDPLIFHQKLKAFLNERAGKEKFILLPMEDDTLNWLSDNRDEISEYTEFLIPSKKSLAVAQSKSETLKLAEQSGVPIPETLNPISLEDFIEKLKQLYSEYKFENYIVKPIIGSGSSGLIYLKDISILDFDWAKHWKKHGMLIIQERIPPEGKGIGVSVLFDADSNCVATFVHSRLQQYPNSGGPSTSRISIKDEYLVELSITLLKKLKWKGVAMVEWKMDPRTSKPKLMEINPRFWGSLELAVRSGVDFPLLYARAVKGEEINDEIDYHTGVVCRWMFPGEILRYLSQSKSERESFKSFLKGFFSTAEEWDRNDIRGFISAFLCPAISILKPKYWKYLRR